jgi:hypothetical protein
MDGKKRARADAKTALNEKAQVRNATVAQW